MLHSFQKKTRKTGRGDAALKFGVVGSALELIDLEQRAIGKSERALLRVVAQRRMDPKSVKQIPSKSAQP